MGDLPFSFVDKKLLYGYKNGKEPKRGKPELYLREAYATIPIYIFFREEVETTQAFQLLDLLVVVSILPLLICCVQPEHSLFNTSAHFSD